MPAFRGARMLGLLNGKEVAPSETMTVEKEGKEVTVDNPAYDRWIERDQRAELPARSAELPARSGKICRGLGTN